MRKRNIILIAIIIIIAIFMIVRFVQLNNQTSQGNGQEISGENILNVRVQNPSKLGARFDLVELSQPGFVVVRGVVNGNAGIIVGVSQLLSGGRNKNVQILMELVPEQEYAAFIYADNGNGQFDEATDSLVVGLDGRPIEARFFVDVMSGFIGK